mmetsp:Transcript_40156/g.78439  ORF Transcript_40156/g.78439 Transcript_40156/m.78439 type:complete len:204 (+) Transcript_40156:1821-2432(+)
MAERPRRGQCLGNRTAHPGPWRQQRIFWDQGAQQRRHERIRFCSPSGRRGCARVRAPARVCPRDDDTLVYLRRGDSGGSGLPGEHGAVCWFEDHTKGASGEPAHTWDDGRRCCRLQLLDTTTPVGRQDLRDGKRQQKNVGRPCVPHPFELAVRGPLPRSVHGDYDRWVRLQGTKPVLRGRQRRPDSGRSLQYRFWKYLCPSNP